MEVLLKLDNKIAAEYLEFESEGRSHKHPYYESFVVLSGEGQIINGDTTHEVQTGDIVSIPPNTDHWMIPKSGSKMTGLLWYHETPVNLSK